MQHQSNPPEPFPLSEEPQLPELDLTTVRRKGVPTLESPQGCVDRQGAHDGAGSAAQVDQGKDGGVPGQTQGAVGLGGEAL